jgi:hypothetical protein
MIMATLLRRGGHYPAFAADRRNPVIRRMKAGCLRPGNSDEDNVGRHGQPEK